MRDRLAVLLALATVVGLGAAFFLAKNTQFLMPGPLTSAHGAIENCDACHSKSGSGKLSWLRGLVAGDPLADSEACLTCHKMPDTAFNAHSAAAAVLQQSTKRLTKIAARTPAPQSARAQSIAFPTDDKVTYGLYCATCHQEHQGVNFSLNKISNEQCRSCHVVKFDSFDGHHPQFENYPFKRRTRIIYDHAGHFGKHFPETAKKEPAKRIPATCSTCHNTRKDKRVMAVAPFERTCAACHLDQVLGKERVSGPKGIAFLAVPGLDLQTLKRRNASVGEWPAASEAELTPFMKVMISRNARGRALIKTVDRLNLQDLSRASNAQIRAVNSLVWEIKRLFYALIMGKASDVLADLDIGDKAKLSANLVADLTASIPRDVIVSAQQQWLPNLGTEMATRQGAAGAGRPSPPAQANQQTPRPEAAKAAAQPEPAARQTDTPNASPGQERLPTESSGSEPAEKRSGPDARGATPGASPEPAGGQAARKGGLDPQPCIVAIFGQCLLSKGPEQLPRPAQAGLKEIAQAAQTEANERPQNRAADQTDDLLHPTPEELRGIAPSTKGAGNATPTVPDAPTNAPAVSDNAAAEPQTRAAPAISIQSDVDAENWAEYGGWYRQDYAIFYRPTGHKDKFIYSWLVLTGRQAPKGDRSPAGAVFDLLTHKDAQGSCTKCHSVDDIRGKGRVVNFSPPSVETKQGRFTNFIHEPHFGILENRGCLTCHNLEKGRPYLQSYEQGNPQIFLSNFGAVKKDLCQTCHTSSMARQDCMLCHKYHVNGVVTPIMKTKIPTE